MPPFIFPFSFSETSMQPVKGWVELEKPLPYTISEGSGYYRLGKLSIEGGEYLDLVLYHNSATTNFIYLRESPPDLESDYRAWWGIDRNGHFIADTACAGYGWSEVFYSPRKQIDMINRQLESRHGLTIADIVRRNFSRK